MRKQKRPREPEEFAANSKRWNAQWAKLRESNPDARFTWYKVNGVSAREIALPPLRAMNQEHCSFCDCYPLYDRSREPIEHFRPKSWIEFYRDAFSWENLYYSCDRCQASKGEQWNPLLLRPDAEDYSFDDYFEFDFTTGSMRPNLTADTGRKERARITIELYGLDEQARRRSRLESADQYVEGQNLDLYSYRDFIQQQPG